MLVLAIVLVLSAALCHATWNIAAKFVSGDRVAFIWAYGGISTLWGLPVGIIVLLATHGPITPMLLIAPLVSGIIHVGYGLALQTGYAKADLGIVYPVARGAGPLLSMIIAIGVLRERPAAIALVGAIVVLIGVAIVASVRDSQTTREGVMRGIFWGTLTGASIAAYTLWDSYAVTHLDINPIV